MSHIHRLGTGLLARAGAALVLASFVFVAACGGGIPGTYSAEQKLPNGETSKITLELKKDGTCTVSVSAGAQSMPSMNGTWTAEGDKVTTVIDNDKTEMTYKDGTLTMESFGEKMVLKKQ